MPLLSPSSQDRLSKDTGNGSLKGKWKTMTVGDRQGEEVDRGLAGEGQHAELEARVCGD